MSGRAVVVMLRCCCCANSTRRKEGNKDRHEGDQEPSNTHTSNSFSKVAKRVKFLLEPPFVCIFFCAHNCGRTRTCDIVFLKNHYHTNGFYWGNQRSWTLILANRIQVSSMQSYTCYRKARFKPTMQWLAVIIVRLDHHGEYRWSNWPRYVGTWFAPPSTSDFSGKVGLNLALGLVTYCCSCQTTWWRPAWCCLGWGSISIGGPSKSQLGWSGALRKI